MSDRLTGFAKKIVLIILLALLTAFLCNDLTSSVYADQKTETVEIESDMGIFMIGAKGWFALWDSAVLDWFEKDISANFKEMGLNLESDIDTGSGYLAGPLFGYQTPDGTWSLSLAAMVFSDFSQDWTGQAGSMKLNTDVDTDRKDIDLAISYSFHGYQGDLDFLRYLRLYGGFKYQKIKYDLTLSYETLMGPRNFDYDLDTDVYTPTIGAGFVYPLMDKLAVGINGGLGLSIIELELKAPDGDRFDIDPDTSIAYNGEATLTYLPIEHFIIQLGFRIQAWYLKARRPQTWDETESRDLTYGPTLSLLYAF
jgi:hypothetical protein